MRPYPSAQRVFKSVGSVSSSLPCYTPDPNPDCPLRPSSFLRRGTRSSDDGERAVGREGRFGWTLTILVSEVGPEVLRGSEV